MKATLLLLSVFFSTAIFSQIECQIDHILPTELIQVAKMDRESFEIYAIDKGYSYYDILITDKINSLVVKRNEWGQEFLRHNTKHRNATLASHETSRVCLLPRWYSNLEAIGFRLNDTREFQGAYVKVYTKEKTNLPKEDFTIYIREDSIQIDYNEYSEIE